MFRKKRKFKKHKYFPLDILEKDEISGDEQLCMIWCYRHKEWEWERIPTPVNN
jgi:hypothetical protein